MSILPKHKYSLWVSPPRDSTAYSQLQSLINQYSTSLGTPVFSPHATLFSPIRTDSDYEAINQVKQYVSKLKQEYAGLDRIPVNITKLQTGKKFYQYVFLEAETSDRVDQQVSLVCANRIAREYWRATDQPEFHPHVSLIYNEPDQEQLSQIVPSIEKILPYDLSVLSFYAEEIRVIETVGPCENWREIGSVPLISDM